MTQPREGSQAQWNQILASEWKWHISHISKGAAPSGKRKEGILHGWLTLHPYAVAHLILGRFWNLQGHRDFFGPLNMATQWRYCYPESHSPSFLEHITVSKKIPPKHEWSCIHLLPHTVWRSTLIGHREPDINTLLATRAPIASPQLWNYKPLTHHMWAFLIIKDKPGNSWDFNAQLQCCSMSPVGQLKTSKGVKSNSLSSWITTPSE